MDGNYSAQEAAITAGQMVDGGSRGETSVHVMILYLYLIALQYYNKVYPSTIKLILLTSNTIYNKQDLLNGNVRALLLSYSLFLYDWVESFLNK